MFNFIFLLDFLEWLVVGPVDSGWWLDHSMFYEGLDELPFIFNYSSNLQLSIRLVKKFLPYSACQSQPQSHHISHIIIGVSKYYYLRNRNQKPRQCVIGLLRLFDNSMFFIKFWPQFYIYLHYIAIFTFTFTNFPLSPIQIVILNKMGKGNEMKPYSLSLIPE